MTTTTTTTDKGRTDSFLSAVKFFASKTPPLPSSYGESDKNPTEQPPAELGLIGLLPLAGLGSVAQAAGQVLVVGGARSGGKRADWPRRARLRLFSRARSGVWLRLEGRRGRRSRPKEGWPISPL